MLGSKQTNKLDFLFYFTLTIFFKKTYATLCAFLLSIKKSMKAITIILFGVLVLTMMSCKKREDEAGIIIRIGNSTSMILDSLRLRYDTSNYNYGTLEPDRVTGYHFFKSMPDDPSALAKTGNNIFMAGPIIPPNTYYIPMLSPGEYTLKIFPDSALSFGFNAKYLKD